MHPYLNTICSLYNILMIPAFFLSAKLLNNEDDKMKEEEEDFLK